MDSQPPNSPSLSLHDLTDDSFLDFPATLSQKTPEQVAAMERFWDGFDDDDGDGELPSQSTTAVEGNLSRQSFEIPRTESPLRVRSLLSRISSRSSESDRSIQASTYSTEKKRPSQSRRARKDNECRSNSSAAEDEEDDVEMRVLRNSRWFDLLCSCQCHWWAGAR
ncbi:hypothetical protein CONPUDRAFT_137544 [Coniophora puteana RWD-64-598 SS2]|uniref:Uncharacterized protein n=1 Tax=Coniophora puteana (strain RWD-64-598) TaxID=741705 RepID=A0A5M3MMI2_CONPW|nr:uncharacterized protein CONPUDRAFT_137544 [Coniophora puteana RWD-64-598 SS2]EIW80246.1 hypothetical protein CONPUDRAFT_137544 [Coniophora puteana RWD-64-598 SS2]